jgi:signal transduction histidine kinase
MVLNELVLNAVEHGINGEQGGQIDIQLRDLGNSVRLEIWNNGRSLPPDFDIGHTTSLGLQIVRTLVLDDLKGKIAIETAPVSVLHKDVDRQANGDAHSPGHLAPTEGEPRNGAGDDRDMGPAAVEQTEGQVGTRAVVIFPKRSLRVD